MTGRRRSGAAAQVIARDAGHVAGGGEFPQSWHEREVREDRGRRGVAEAGRGGWACIELGRSQLERSRPSLPCSLARPRACTRVCVRVIHGIAHCGWVSFDSFPVFACRGFSCHEHSYRLTARENYLPPDMIRFSHLACCALCSATRARTDRG